MLAVLTTLLTEEDTNIVRDLPTVGNERLGWQRHRQWALLCYLSPIPWVFPPLSTSNAGIIFCQTLPSSNFRFVNLFLVFTSLISGSSTPSLCPVFPLTDSDISIAVCHHYDTTALENLLELS